jgi:DnaJ-class molecular chaperone
MNEPSKTHYSILGAAFLAPHGEVHDRFLALAKKLHPDTKRKPVYADAVRFQEVTDAYATLKDKARRRAYDQGLLTRFTVCPSCKGYGAQATGRVTRKTCAPCGGLGLKEKAK